MREGSLHKIKTLRSYLQSCAVQRVNVSPPFQDWDCLSEIVLWAVIYSTSLTCRIISYLSLSIRSTASTPHFNHILPFYTKKHTHSTKAPVTGGHPYVLKKKLRFTVHVLRGVMVRRCWCIHVCRTFSTPGTTGQ